MAQATDITTWIAFFLGLYLFTVGIGGWRNPGQWAAMLGEYERSAALRLTTGAFTLALGAIIYLVNPWRPDDWLAVLVSVVGAWTVIKGALFLALGDRYLAFAQRLIGSATRAYAIVTLVLGAALIAVSALRFG